MSRAVFSAASRLTKKFTKTRAPASAKRSAMARPIPRPPPVTRTSRRRQLPGVSGRAQLSAEPELVARTHEVAERDAREPRQAAHLRPVVTHPDEELRGLPECLDDQRSREDRRAWEMVGEDVFCRADV